MSSLLFGVSATDPPTFIIISLVLINMAMLASYIPARRATKGISQQEEHLFHRISAKGFLNKYMGVIFNSHFRANLSMRFLGSP